MTFEVIMPMLQKNEKGEVFVTRKVAKKDAAGNVVFKGDKKVYEMKDKVVTAWTVNTLFLCLEQSKAKK